MTMSDRKIRATSRSLFKSLFCTCDSSSESPEGKEDEELSKLVEVLGIHLVLNKISEYLETCDLLTCRLVSWSWNNLFTNLLLRTNRRPSPTLEICFQQIAGRYTLYQNHPKMAPQPLQQFSDLLKNSKKLHSLFPFPCISFKFFGGTLKDPELQSFLNRFGKNVVDLELALQSSDPKEKDVHLIHKLILDQLPNIRCLKLLMSSIFVTDSYNFGSSFLTFPSSSKSKGNVFQNLDSIIGPEIPAPFMKKLVEARPNLRAISFTLEIHTLPFFKYLMTSEKLGLIKHFVFCPVLGDVEKWEHVFETVEGALTPNFSLLTLEVDLKRFDTEPSLSCRAASLILKIMQLSHSSLKNLKTRLPLPDQSHENWPILTGVSDMHLYLECSPGHQLQNFDLGHKFPNLRRLKFGPWGFAGQAESFVGVAASVRKIEFLGTTYPPSHSELIPNLHNLFPNLEDLTVENSGGDREIGHRIWACRKLKKLKLTLQLHDIISATQLDSFFTGFSGTTCRMLHQQATGSEFFSSEKLNRMLGFFEGDLSIAHVHDLEKLTIKIVVHKDSILCWPERVMSEVTGKHVFNSLNCTGKVTICVENSPLCSGPLKVEYYEKLWTVLQDIAPYATIYEFLGYCR